MDNKRFWFRVIWFAASLEDSLQLAHPKQRWIRCVWAHAHSDVVGITADFTRERGRAALMRLSANQLRRKASEVRIPRSRHLERWPSGKAAGWKPVGPQGSVGSSPARSSQTGEWEFESPRVHHCGHVV